ncbi:hypothetical protein L6164_007442 [Bauhinia variegata]|uniref:Uncharacterized protein n=1 Tax=Bauhinia variegata TaxID=167791 RepID=A0ACB9PF03_BAUVA|nr:hypothetical protein L6164_007442 [Bauhinia variegata]
MRGKATALVKLSNSLYSPIKRYPITELAPPISGFQAIRPLSTSSSPTTTIVEEPNKTPPKSQRDALLLEKFRLRKLKGSSETVLGNPQAASNSTGEKVVEKGLQNEGEPPQQVTKFEDLGLSEELILALKVVGIFAPSDIQCVGIPAVLDGKNVLLSSESGSARTLAYLLPLIQLLRRDAKLGSSKSQQPPAILLCASEEKSEECFNVAKLIIHNAEVKSAKDGTSPQNELGLVIGTPSEIVRYIEEGTVIPNEIRYLVLDDADCMFQGGLGPEIHKVIKPLNDGTSESTSKGLQTVLITSTISEILGEQSSVVKRLEHDHGGQILSMVLEMDQTEVFHITESLDALRKKLAEAMDSLCVD